MQKKELKETLIAILRYIKSKASTDNTPLNLDEAIEYIQNNDAFLEEINYRQNSVEEILESLKNEYKELALSSINSYEKTNKEFHSIAQVQQKHLESLEEEKDDGTINLDLIREKFNSVQEHMIQEVERANMQITQLREKVKLLEEKNNLDSLTKAFNRRALTTYLSNLTSKKTLKRELHLLMIDIDDFKAINDRYGHIAGDKILIFLAHILKKTLRDGDKVFRYGGEEFVIILNRIDTPNCKKIANRILQLVNTNKLIYKNNTIQVTVSIGGTKYRPGDTPDTLLERADKALYAAKRAGKNRFYTLEEQ